MTVHRLDWTMTLRKRAAEVRTVTAVSAWWVLLAQLVPNAPLETEECVAPMALEDLMASMVAPMASMASMVASMASMALMVVASVASMVASMASMVASMASMAASMRVDPTAPTASIG